MYQKCIIMLQFCVQSLTIPEGSLDETFGPLQVIPLLRDPLNEDILLLHRTLMKGILLLHDSLQKGILIFQDPFKMIFFLLHGPLKTLRKLFTFLLGRPEGRQDVSEKVHVPADSIASD